MELPESADVDIARLSAVFADTTNSYKFYWLLAILDSLRDNGQPLISMRELTLRMVAGVWYPLDYFKLSFGKQDGFKPIAEAVSKYLTVDNRPSAPPLLAQLNRALAPAELAALTDRAAVLLRWVPFRFIRPFFEAETRGLQDHQINGRIAELTGQSAKAPYRFVNGQIEVPKPWLDYLQKHQGVLRGFVCWHLLRFVQKHNPNVIGLSEKLEKPGARVLNVAGKFWKEYLTAMPDLTCIYSGQQLTTANLSLDHFLPWSYVAHDQLWNIIPTPKAVNSAKNDWLPSLEKYFDAYARLQYAGFQFHAAQGRDKLLEDYHLLFARSLTDARQQPFVWFRERLAQQVIPQLQTARNLGFSYPFEYNERRA